MPLRVLAQHTALCQQRHWAHVQLPKRQETGRREERVLNPSLLGIELLSATLDPQPLMLAPLRFCTSSSPSFSQFPLPFTFLSDSFTFTSEIPQYNPDGTRRWGVLPPPCPVGDPCHGRCSSYAPHPADLSVPSTSTPQGLQGLLSAGLDAASPVR